MQRITLCLFVYLQTLVTFAGEDHPSMEWGEVPIEQLKMTNFHADTNATAVVLFDYGDVHFDQEYDIVYKRHTRIKILTKAGFDLATHKISYYAKDKTQTVRDIEGQTILLSADGKTETKELDSDEIFDEKLGENWRQMKFTLPALTAGCVIEYRYTIRSTNPWYMPNWDFQTSEPTLWSEFKVKNPPVFQYASVWMGYLPFHIKTIETAKERFATASGSEVMNMTLQRFVVKDAPALRDEPYITTLDDYRKRLTFQLALVQWPGEMAQRMLESWEKVAQELNDHKKFGSQLSGFGAVRKQTEAITAGINDPIKKMEAVYDFVRRTIVWNDRRGVVATHDMDDILESKTGNVADVNLLLTLMMRHAGLTANPVLLSTRSNGKIQTLYPIVDQFNYVICKVEVGNHEFLMDATDRYRPFSLLPQRALNHTGFLVKDGKYEWVTIEPNAKGKNLTSVNVALTEDGAIAGNVEMAFREYSASRERNQMSGEKKDEYVKKLLKSETSGIIVDSITIDDKDSVGATFLVEAKISSAAYGQALNEFLYFNPMVVDRSSENPFKLEKRLFPVDFAYPISATYAANITLPQGYIAKELPKDVNIRLPFNGGSFSRMMKTEGNLLQVQERFDISQVVFEPREYSGLRRFYEQIVAAENEQVVLQKIATPAPEEKSVQPVKQATIKSKKK